MRDMSGKIAVIGGGTVDSYFNIKNWAELGDKIFAKDGGSFMGGTTFNMAAMAAGLGSHVSMFDIMNKQTTDGKFISEQFKNYGIDDSNVIHDDNAVNSKALIMLHQSGERVIIIVEAIRPRVGHFKRFLSELSSSDALYTMVSIASLFDDGLEVIDELVQNKKTIVLDCDCLYDTEQRIELAKKATYPIFNIYSYDRYSSLVEEDAAQYLLARNANAVICTKGGDGAYVYTSEGSFEIEGIKVDAIDTTGAGDSFAGGFTYAITSGYTPVEAAKFANAVAAHSVTFMGAVGGVCSKEEILKFIEKNS